MQTEDKKALVEAKIKQINEAYEILSNEDYYTNLQNAMKKAYYDAYIQSLKDRGYTIKYKKNFKDYLRIFIAYLSLFIIIFLIWKIPFTKKILLNIYNSNEYLKLFIDIIIEFFASIISAFKTIFTFSAS